MIEERKKIPKHRIYHLAKFKGDVPKCKDVRKGLQVLREKPPPMPEMEGTEPLPGSTRAKKWHRERRSQLLRWQKQLLEPPTFMMREKSTKKIWKGRTDQPGVDLKRFTKRKNPTQKFVVLEYLPEHNSYACYGLHKYSFQRKVKQTNTRSLEDAEKEMEAISKGSLLTADSVKGMSSMSARERIIASKSKKSKFQARSSKPSLLSRILDDEDEELGSSTFRSKMKRQMGGEDDSVFKKAEAVDLDTFSMGIFAVKNTHEDVEGGFHDMDDDNSEEQEQGEVNDRDLDLEESKNMTANQKRLNRTLDMITTGRDMTSVAKELDERRMTALDLQLEEDEDQDQLDFDAAFAEESGSDDSVSLGDSDDSDDGEKSEKSKGDEENRKRPRSPDQFGEEDDEDAKSGEVSEAEEEANFVTAQEIRQAIRNTPTGRLEALQLTERVASKLRTKVQKDAYRALIKEHCEIKNDLRNPGKVFLYLKEDLARDEQRAAKRARKEVQRAKRREKKAKVRLEKKEKKDGPQE